MKQDGLATNTFEHGGTEEIKIAGIAVSAPNRRNTKNNLLQRFVGVLVAVNGASFQFWIFWQFRRL